MSPSIEAEPLSAPKRVSGLRLAGISWVMGTPFFVIKTASPVAATSSMILRHFALNSEALIVLIYTPAYMTIVMTMVTIGKVLYKWRTGKQD